MIRSSRSHLFAILAVLVVVSNIGCHPNATPHPNQINSFDGQAYDRLTEAQAALNEAKAQYQAGKISGPATKQIINAAGSAYETTRTSWQTWRDIVQGKTAGDANAAQLKLTQDMNQLAAAIVNLKSLIGGK